MAAASKTSESAVFICRALFEEARCGRRTWMIEADNSPFSLHVIFADIVPEDLY